MARNNIIEKRAKLSDFHRVISKEIAKILEKNIRESRNVHKILHEKRIERLKLLN